MSRAVAGTLQKRLVACVALVAVALLAGFYSVVNNAVEVSASRRAESASRTVAQARQIGSMATAKLVLVGSSKHDD